MTKKIMVVDDDPGVIFTVKHGLEGLDPDCQIITENSGFQCLEKLENDAPPDLILLDIMMPNMSVWETYKKMRKNQK